MSLKPIVSLQKAKKSYGDYIALHEINLDIAPGEFVTLLGPSGCGKTTTLRLIGGFETLDGGTVEIAGEDVTRLPPSQRAVNTVFQDYALFPHMTVAENVAYGLKVKLRSVSKAAREKQVMEALSLVGLSGKKDEMPTTLSGGQRQRVAMARALVLKPKVLLLDEPLSALDVKLRASMQVELRHLHQKLGITFLMVTHDQEEALVMSDRIVVMGTGRIVQVGTPQDLYDRPASPYVADFIGSANIFAGTLVRVDDGHSYIRLADGSTLEGRAVTQGIQLGANVIVAVRPERLAISNEQGLPAQVVDHMFHGSQLRLELKTSISPKSLFLDIPRSSSSSSIPHPNIGENIRIAPINGADVMVYPEELF